MKSKLQCKTPKSFYKLNIFAFLFMIFSFGVVHSQNGNSQVDGGTISTNDNTSICLDGNPDPIYVNLTGASGRQSQWIITDDENNILGLPESPPFDLDGAPPGICRIWHLSYNGIPPFRHIQNLSDLRGRYDLSNYIEVTRNSVNGGDLVIVGGDTEITICAGDGVSDAFDVELEEAFGANSLWVITDSDLNILGTPPGPPFDLEGAGEGVCLIWHLSYSDDVDLTGVSNAGDLMGCYSLSNPITVTRNGVNGGDLSIVGGDTEITICAGDGVSDAFDVELEEAFGANSLWVITDSDLNILGTPPGPPFDLEGAGEGVCLIWHLSYSDDVDLADVSNAGDLMGCYSLSNPITVTRNGVNGGELIGGPFEFTVGDGSADNIPDGAITLSGNSGTNSQWIVTDDQGNVLGLPPNPYVVNFDGAGSGTCLIWHLSFEGDPDEVLNVSNASELEGCYDLSNPISVIRTENLTDIKLFPNPSKGNVVIHLINPKLESNTYSISVYDIYSTRVLNQTIQVNNLDKNKMSLDLKHLIKGTYFVQITNNIEGSQIMKKLIIK